MESIENSIVVNPNLKVQKMELGSSVNRFIHPFRLMLAGINLFTNEIFINLVFYQ